MIPFNKDKSAFGRHETFPLRFGWLTKGFAAWDADPRVFESDDATVELGVGKNMVSAIRYWMTAAQVIAVTNRRKVAATDLGERIFGEKGWDPYLEDDATVWLLHWLIASNATEATSIFWFFNRFHKPEFTTGELEAALTDFVTRETSSRATSTTIKHDLNLLLRMYEPTRESKFLPLEEILDSPLSMLGLLKHVDGSRFHESRPENRSMPVMPFAFAVAQLFEHQGASAMSVDALLRSDGIVACPGAVFCLSEEGLIAKIEEVISWMPGVFELRETAGIKQLYQLRVKEPNDVLRLHYQGTQHGRDKAK